MPHLNCSISTTARFHLRVSAGAVRSGLAGRHGRGWRVRVAAPPEGGRANAELQRYLAGIWAVPASAVRIVHGAGSRDKLVEVSGIDQAVAEAALDAASPRF